MAFAPKTMIIRLVALALVAGSATGTAVVATAQRSAGYQFLQAVRERDGAKVQEILNEPGTVIVNTRDPSTNGTALHIVTERRDLVWIRFLLAQRADPNLGDRDGSTPLMIAANLGFVDGIQALVAGGARINQANGRGETALHFAVQRRDVNTVRALVEAGADPELQDSVAGKSPRDYASEDVRLAAVLAALDRRTPAPIANPLVAGPR